MCDLSTWNCDGMNGAIDAASAAIHMVFQFSISLLHFIHLLRSLGARRTNQSRAYVTQTDDSIGTAQALD